MSQEQSPATPGEDWIDFYAGLHPAKIVPTADPMVTHDYYDVSQLKAAFDAGQASQSEGCIECSLSGRAACPEHGASAPETINTIDRYEVIPYSSGDQKMLLDPDGDWVMYSDAASIINRLVQERSTARSEIAERPSAVYTSNESRLAHALREFIEASKRTEPKYGDCLALAEWTLNETSVSSTPCSERERDLAMMVRRLAARIRLRSTSGPHAVPDYALSKSAMEFLQRLGLEGSPLRDEPRLTNGE